MSLLGRELSPEEHDELERWSRSRTKEARLVDRANIVLAASTGRGMMDVCRAIGKDKHTVRLWVDRYLAEGLDGLRDRPRSGHPCEYSAEQRAEVVQAALTRPSELGQPFAHWTFTRLADYMHEVKHIPISRTRIAEILAKEGLRWHHDESWYGERLDPEFTKKRGRLSRPTVVEMKRASLSASTKWGL